MKKTWLLMCAIWLASCRLGGPSPEALWVDELGGASSVQLDAGSTSEQAEPEQSDPVQPVATMRSDAGGSTGTADAGTRAPATAGKPAASSPVPDSTDAGADALSCGQSATIAVCDPIANTGCSKELGMQCDVDLLASSLSGICVFSAPRDGPCVAIPPTESCPAGETCIDGDRCHKICLCDTDCDSGSCCNTPLGGAGFMVCGSC